MTDMCKIKLNRGQLKGLPGIYEPDEKMAERTRKGFFIAVPVELVTPHIDLYPRYQGQKKRTHYWVSSRRRPMVVPGVKPIKRLVQELAELDAMNVSRDNVFTGEDLLLVARKYRYNNIRSPFTDKVIEVQSLLLVSVEFLSDRTRRFS